MSRVVLRLVAALACGALLLACAAPAATSAPQWSATASFERCPWSFGQAGVDVIRERAAWEQLLAQAKPIPASVQVWKPQFDAKQAIVLVRAGMKPSAGFSLQLQAPAAPQAGKALRLPVLQTRPAPGTLQASVVTSPCAIGWLNQPGSASVELIDAQTAQPLPMPFNKP